MVARETDLARCANTFLAASQGAPHEFTAGDLDGASRRLADDTAKLSREKELMNDELLASVEREVPGWPGVWKKRDGERPG